MDDESITISAKTWNRTVGSIHKVRYSDGVVDGQNNTFQESFDMGYEEGFNFAYNSTSQNRSRDIIQDNCIICSNSSNLKENVMNLCNLQKDSNKKIIKDCKIPHV